MSEARFILRESKVVDGKQKEFPILSTSGKTKLNEVRLVRDGFHTIKLCLQNEIAKKLWTQDFDNSEGLELIVRDKTRGEDDEFELKIWPLSPYRLERIDNQVQLATFRVVAFPTPYWNRTYWDSWDYAESTYAQAGAVNQVQLGNYLTEHSFFGEINAELFGSLAPSVTQQIKNAAIVGVHSFVRADQAENWWHSLAAITGTHWWIGNDDAKMHLCLANSDQDLEADLPPDEYLVQQSDRIDKTWIIPYLRRHYYRMALSESTYTWEPIVTQDTPGLVTLPTWYQPTQQSNGVKYRPVDHYSTMILPRLMINDAGATSQAYVDELAGAWERSTKAVERTLNGWFRASTRNDWKRYGGYHPVSLGSEVTQVLYRQRETLVDFRGKHPPLWPKAPAVSLPSIAFCKLTIAQKIVSPGQPTRFVGSISPPHSGPWSPAIAAQAIPSVQFGINFAPTTQTSVTAEDSLGLYPWLDVGDTVLIVYDGSRGVVINTTIAADLP